MYSDPSHASRGKVKQAPFLWWDRVDQYGASPMIYMRPPPLFCETPTPSPSPQGGGGLWRHAQPTPSPLWGGLGWGSERKDLAKRRICPSSGCRHLLPARGEKDARGCSSAPFSPRAGRRSRQGDEGQMRHIPHLLIPAFLHIRIILFSVSNGQNPFRGLKTPQTSVSTSFRGVRTRALCTRQPHKAGEVAAHVQGESLKAATPYVCGFSAPLATRDLLWGVNFEGAGS